MSTRQRARKVTRQAEKLLGRRIKPTGLGKMYRRMAKKRGLTVRQCMDTGFYTTIEANAGVEVIRLLALESEVRAIDVALYVRNRTVPQSVIESLAATRLPAGERRAEFLGQQL